MEICMNRQHMDVNRNHWDELVPHHHKSAFYDVDAFKAGKNTIDEISLQHLGDLSGKTLLHLQCHFGMDTISLARMGATATGIDFSEPAIELARSLASELDVDVRFIHTNLYDLPDHLDEQFDIVFTSFGTITWLPDIQGWAQIVSRYLKPGGLFFILDGHPLAWILNQEVEAGYEVEFSYFSEGQIFTFSEEGSYASSASTQNQTTHEWHHQFGSIINALITSGLTIQHIGEYPLCAWQMLPFLKRDDDGWWRLPEEYPQLPLLFSIQATK